MSRIDDHAPFLQVATVVKTIGLEGELLVRTEPGALLLFEEGRCCYLAPPLLDEKLLQVTRCELSARGLRLRFAEIGERGRAHELVGRSLLLKTADVPAARLEAFLSAGKGDFEEIGYEVYSDDGTRLGILRERIETPANAVWVVAADEGELLLPVIADLQIVRDDERRRVTVTLLEGLLEANR
ncbi:MAG: hypothetical protein FWC48_02115 [Actinomycetia bacterium]|nr:hypothetical protein [Actinomycetes bacterium]